MESAESAALSNSGCMARTIRRRPAAASNNWLSILFVPLRFYLQRKDLYLQEHVMKAVCWMGKESMKVQNVPDPEIINPKDAIIRITRTAICGSDLHLYGGFIPSMESGDIMGHEFMGIVEEVGREVKKLKRGDRVVIPFTIACGNCLFCRKPLWSLCDNSNPNAHV